MKIRFKKVISDSVLFVSFIIFIYIVKITVMWKAIVQIWKI